MDKSYHTQEIAINTTGILINIFVAKFREIIDIFSGVNNKMTEVSKSAFTIAEIGPLILTRDLAYGQTWTMTFAQKNIDKMQCMHLSKQLYY